MTTLAIKFDPVAIDVYFTETDLHVRLADGRALSAPLVWFPRLRNASSREREDWRFIGNGMGIHWESVDEDISIESLLTMHL